MLEIARRLAAKRRKRESVTARFFGRTPSREKNRRLKRP